MMQDKMERCASSSQDERSVLSVVQQPAAIWDMRDQVKEAFNVISILIFSADECHIDNMGFIRVIF